MAVRFAPGDVGNAVSMDLDVSESVSKAQHAVERASSGAADVLSSVQSSLLQDARELERRGRKARRRVAHRVDDQLRPQQGSLLRKALVVVAIGGALTVVLAVIRRRAGSDTEVAPDPFGTAIARAEAADASAPPPGVPLARG